MAKRKKKSSKRERIPVIDFLIDMAAAATMDYIAYKRRQKRGGRRSNKIDPYEATGIAMGLGMIDDTEDLIKFGGMLGMMGAFDPDEPDEVYQNSYVGSHEDNPFYAPKNNKYAWRLNCEDGSEYGICRKTLKRETSIIKHFIVRNMLGVSGVRMVLTSVLILMILKPKASTKRL